MPIKLTIAHFKLHPNQLFLVDGCGAILSAFLLGVILVKFEKYFGIPSSTLYFLATLPIFFAVYDFYCFKKENGNLGRLLQRIAILNLLYCLISIGFAFYHSETITKLGWVYILLEVFIVASLAVIELKVAKEKNGLTL